MLLLRRKKEETIDISSGLMTIRVIDVKGGIVTLGINAPKEMKILRGELTGYGLDVERSKGISDGSGNGPADGSGL